MSNKNVTDGDIQTQKWIKDGRGQGHGAAYKPWITVRDIASQDRSHRVFGHTTQRTHRRCSIYVLVNVFTPPNSHDFASLCFCSHTRNHAK